MNSAVDAAKVAWKSWANQPPLRIRSDFPLFYTRKPRQTSVSSISTINKINKTIIDDVDYIIALSYQGNPDAGLMASDKIYNTINGGDFFIKNLSYSDIVIFKNKKLTE